MIPISFYPNMSQGIRAIKGVGPQMEKALRRRGFDTLEDLAFLTPVRYQDRRKFVPLNELSPGLEAMAAGRIERVDEGRFSSTGRRYFQLTIEDETGRINALWFSFPVHLRRTLKKGRRVGLFGLVQEYKNTLQMVHPEITVLDGKIKPAPEVRPVYPEFDDLKAGALRKVVNEAMDRFSGAPLIFPEGWLKRRGLTDPTTALRIIHQPPADRPGPLPRPDESNAWKSLALAELLFLQLSLARSRARQAGARGWSCPDKSELVESFFSALPFHLTKAQQKAFEEIRSDMASPKPMNRLLQGDVGSGKTVAAMAAAFLTVDGGRQAAVMAPTEILARQHYLVFKEYGEKLNVKVELLIGSMTESEKSRVRAATADGGVDILIGTQSLISSAIEYKSLGLGVIDEQHRFGVAQRLALREKAGRPDLLVMTATPIPRSLAMTLYGDLDVSTIDEFPPGRTPAVTEVFTGAEREKAYLKLVEEVNNGAQAFIVAPRIDSRDENGDDLASTEDLYRYISDELLADVPVGLVHGRMRPDEQSEVMESFRSGRLRVLTATTVIEVGVDVPQASVILIEGAERFGLAQLHQLRGRIGRGSGRQSYCLLVAGESNGDPARLRLMEKSNDGFYLAEEDLKLRGPGDSVGLKQSGMPKLTFAALPRDLSLLIKARDLAAKMVAKDPELSDPGFKLVREAVNILEDRIRVELADVG